MDIQRQAGSIAFDGLIEGPVPPGEESRRKLEEWTSFARQNAFVVSLEFDANRFSILPRNESISADRFNGKPQERIKDLLSELLKIFPAGDRTKVFSTIRGVEYRDASKVETIYRIDAAGAIAFHEREVEWTPAPPPPPRPAREKYRAYFSAAVVLLLLLLFSTFVVDYRALWSDLVGLFNPVNADEITIDARDVSAYLRVEKRDLQNGGSLLEIEWKRADGYPTTVDAYLKERERAVADKDFTRLKVLESIVQGTITLEYYESGGKLISTVPLRIKELATKESFRCTIPIDHRHRPLTVRISH